MRRPAGPFANAERAGRSLQWLGLNVPALTLTAPAVTFAAGGVDYNVFVLAPASGSLKGVATVERIRGWMHVYWVDNVSATGNALVVWQSIQVLKLTAGDVETLNATTVINLNQLDQDSLGIMWQQMYYPLDFTDTSVFQSHVNARDLGMCNGNIDVRVKRRVDFSQFFLAHVIATPTALGLGNIRVGLFLRGLFKAPGPL